MNGHKDREALRTRVIALENELEQAKAQLRQEEGSQSNETKEALISDEHKSTSLAIVLPLSSASHNLMLLSDSALPLGSFAYSSGLESFLAHNKASGVKDTNLMLFNKFVKLSIQSMAYTNIPYALAAFREPKTLPGLDNDLDASTPCNVARRASIAQGRALLSVWERAFSATAKQQHGETGSAYEAATILESFSKDLKIASITSSPFGIATVNGHLAPVWGTVCFCLGLSLEESAYLFLLNHAKAVVSAAVRASVMGPYMAQSVLASRDMQELIGRCLERVWSLQTDDAGQLVPMLDLWVGRHELLYSRIFNS